MIAAEPRPRAGPRRARRAPAGVRRRRRRRAVRPPDRRRTRTRSSRPTSARLCHSSTGEARRHLRGRAGRLVLPRRAGVRRHGPRLRRDAHRAPGRVRGALPGRRALAALVFDYLGFGASAGEPRQVVDIKAQLDAVAAGDRLRPHARRASTPTASSLWGTSFSGGHVMVLAAEDAAIAAAISQGAFADGLATLAGFGAAQQRAADLARAARPARRAGRPAAAPHPDRRPARLRRRR